MISITVNNQVLGVYVCLMQEDILKKEILVPKEDYINNIIGLPHGESRTMYLFN